MRYYLYDPEEDRFIWIHDGFTIGREDGNLTFPEDELMSRTHCRLHIDEKGVKVEDLGSRNRTRVNTWRIEPMAPHLLSLHDLVGVGNRRFVFTNQNLYKPTPNASISGRQLLAPADQTIVVKERKSILKKVKEETTRLFHLPRLATLLGLLKSIRIPSSPRARKASLLLALGAFGLMVFKLLPNVPRPVLEAERASGPDARAASQPANASAAALRSGFERYWKSYAVEGRPSALYIRDESVLSRKSPSAAMRENLDLLKEFLALPRTPGWNLPLGRDTAAEGVADFACAAAASGAQNPSLSVTKIVEDAPPERQEWHRLTGQEAGAAVNPAIFLGAAMTIRFPVRDNRIEIASALIDCKDPPGKRVIYAQQKASVINALQTKAVLSFRVLAHERERLRTLTNHHSKEALKGVRLSTLIKGYRNLAGQVSAFAAWSRTDGEFASRFSDYIRNEERELLEAYEYGRKVYPSLYPTLPSTSTLEEQDLLFLTAY